MRNWISRLLAAIGAGGRKAEADVSYDPALDDDASGGDIPPSAQTAGPGDGPGPAPR